MEGNTNQKNHIHRTCSISSKKHRVIISSHASIDSISSLPAQSSHYIDNCYRTISAPSIEADGLLFAVQLLCNLRHLNGPFLSIDIYNINGLHNILFFTCLLTSTAIVDLAPCSNFASVNDRIRFWIWQQKGERKYIRIPRKTVCDVI